jgi:uncharacterized phage-associated protein
MRNVIQVANFFIKKGIDEGKHISPMKLQKLLYFAYGWYWAIENKRLFNEQFEAWKYGPVVNIVYARTKSYGAGPITDTLPSDTLDYLLGIENITLAENDQSREFLATIWKAYLKYSAVQLSNATHLPDTPWDKAIKENGGKIGMNYIIKDEYFLDYFKPLYDNASKTN